MEESTPIMKYAEVPQSDEDALLEQKPEHPQKVETESLSGFSAYLNLLNTIIGSGFLTYPYCLMVDGWVQGIIKMLAFAFMCIITCFQLVDVSTETHAYQYYSIARRLFKSKAVGYLISSSIVFQTFGSLITYATVIQQNFFWWQGSPEVVQSNMLWIQLLLWSMLLLLIFPLSSFKNLDWLHFTSWLNILGFFYVTIVVLIYFCGDHPIPEPPQTYNLNFQSLSTLSLFQNAYACQYQIANVYRDLKQKSPSKMRKVVIATFATVCGMYVCVSLTGYFTFTTVFKENSNLLMILATKVDNAPYVQAGNAIMLVGMVAHYPLICFPLRRTIESYFWRDADAKVGWRMLIAFLLILSTGILGSLLTDIEDVLVYKGAIFGSCVMFIFPAIFGFKIWLVKRGTARLLIALATLTCGIFVLIIGTTSAAVTQSIRGK